MKTLTVQVAYGLGDIVFLRVAEERIAGMVTSISVRPGHVIYMVSWDGGLDTYHYEMELTSEFVQSFEQ